MTKVIELVGNTIDNVTIEYSNEMQVDFVDWQNLVIIGCFELSIGERMYPYIRRRSE